MLDYFTTYGFRQDFTNFINVMQQIADNIGKVADELRFQRLAKPDADTSINDQHKGLPSS